MTDERIIRLVNQTTAHNMVSHVLRWADGDNLALIAEHLVRVRHPETDEPMYVKVRDLQRGQVRID